MECRNLDAISKSGGMYTLMPQTHDMKVESLWVQTIQQRHQLCLHPSGIQRIHHFENLQHPDM